MSDRDDRLPQKHKLFRRALHAVVNEFLIRVTTQQERQRRQIGNLDMTIAAHALAQGAVLVTNEEAFKRDQRAENRKLGCMKFLCLKEGKMRSSVGIFTVILLLFVPRGVFADSHAYIVAPGTVDTTPGSITPFNTAKGELGAGFFVPRGNLIAVPPGTKQIWQTVGFEYCQCNGPWQINILDPKSGGTLATIPLASYVISLIFDTAGQYAYASLGNGTVIKIDVASLAIVLTGSLGAGANASQLVLPSDGSKLFASAYGPDFEGRRIGAQTCTKRSGDCGGHSLHSPKYCSVHGCFREHTAGNG